MLLQHGRTSATVSRETNVQTREEKKSEKNHARHEKGRTKGAAKRQTMKINYFLRQSETRKMCENG